MKKMAYLHNHTHYSNIRLIDAIIKPEQLIDYTYELGASGVAITEHECLSSHVKALKYYKDFLKEKNITPEDFKLILGDEIYLVDNVKEIRDNFDKEKHGFWHFILLAKDKIGYHQLKRISSTAWNQSFFQRKMERVPIEKEQLKIIIGNDKGHLISSSACLGGELPQLIAKKSKAEDENLIRYYDYQIDNFIKFNVDLFGQDNFYLEMQPSFSKDQILVNQALIKLSKIYNLKLIISTDSHYLQKKDRYVHKAFLNSHDGEREVDEFYATTYVMPSTEIWEYFKDLLSENEFDEILENTNSIAKRCEHYDLFHKQVIPSYDVEFELLNIKSKYDNIIDVSNYARILEMKDSNDIQNKLCFWKCYDGLVDKVLSVPAKADNLTKYLEKWDEECGTLLDISPIVEDTMSKYYNTIKHLMDIIWTDGDSIIGPGRGSANGFLICYLMDITQDDPVVFNLPSFRHISVTRPELPDVDYDGESLKRDKIINAFKKHFGYYNVLNIATFGTEKPKSSILTSCRGYRSEEFPDGIDVDIALYISSMIKVERGIQWTLEDCYYGNKEKGREPIKEFVEEIDKYPGLKDIIFSINGLISRRGQHASGIYIFNKEGFMNYNAIMKSPNGTLTTQFDMEDSDYQGCLKYDNLSTEATDKIRKTLDLLLEYGYIEDKGSLKDTYNFYLHPDKLDYETTEMWEVLGRNEIIDAFQMNTPVGQAALKKIKPTNIVELAHVSSLMRLMGKQGQLTPIDKYVLFKNDINLWYQEMSDYGLTQEQQEMFEKYLKIYYGIAATQEDVMRICMDKDLCGLSLKEANKVRKAIAKKKASMIDEIREMVHSYSCDNNVFNYIWHEIIEPQLG